MLYSIGKFAKEIGVTTQTLRNWHKIKELIPIKVTTGGTRYYSDKQIFNYLNGDTKIQRQNVIYARVSTSNQKDDLHNQIEFLKNFSNAKGWVIHEVLTDIGSGLNFKRKNWNSILKRVQSGEISKVIVAHKDRFLRFGFEWFENFLQNYECELIVVNNETLSPQEELVQDLISIIHTFSCRIYGLRKYKKVLNGDKDVKGI